MFENIKLKERERKNLWRKNDILTENFYGVLNNEFIS